MVGLQDLTNKITRGEWEWKSCKQWYYTLFIHVASMCFLKSWKKSLRCCGCSRWI